LPLGFAVKERFYRTRIVQLTLCKDKYADTF
jgi:hypothetical protein